MPYDPSHVKDGQASKKEVNYYERVRDEFYREQAQRSRNRYSSLPTNELPGALATAEANILFQDERETTNEDVRLIAIHVRACAVQDVAIIREIMQERAGQLTERSSQLYQQLEKASDLLKINSDQLSLLRPYLTEVAAQEV